MGSANTYHKRSRARYKMEKLTYEKVINWLKRCKTDPAGVASVENLFAELGHKYPTRTKHGQLTKWFEKWLEEEWFPFKDTFLRSARQIEEARNRAGLRNLYFVPDEFGRYMYACIEPRRLWKKRRWR